MNAMKTRILETLVEAQNSNPAPELPNFQLPPRLLPGTPVKFSKALQKTLFNGPFELDVALSKQSLKS